MPINQVDINFILLPPQIIIAVSAKDREFGCFIAKYDRGIQLRVESCELRVAN